MWGEKVDHCQVQREQFLMSVPAEKAKSKQSTLPFLTGLEWIAYLLVKEMAWEAVETAFYMKEVATWEKWDVLECDDTMAQAEVCSVRVSPNMQLNECGTAQINLPIEPTPTPRNEGEVGTMRGGGGKVKIT